MNLNAVSLLHGFALGVALMGLGVFCGYVAWNAPVVAEESTGRIVGLQILHRCSEFGQRTIVDDQRLKVRKHFPEHAGIGICRQRIEKSPCRMAAGPAMTGLNIDVVCHWRLPW